jgi:hypothetical protein
MNIRINNWLPHYLKALFIISQTYKSTFKGPDPDGFFADENQLKLSFKCFITTLINLVPDKNVKDIMVAYIHMDETVAMSLLEDSTLKYFFISNPDLNNVVNQTPKYNYSHTIFLDYCLQSEDLMFKWVYLLQTYIFMTMNKYGNYIVIPSFNKTKEMYRIENMSKDDWGNVIWFIIHTTALYSTTSMDETFENYKAMLSCLQYLLPCPKCRNHLRSNLRFIDIDYCKQNREKLFECSWKLHNIVNKSLNKYEPTLSEARQIYIFY